MPLNVVRHCHESKLVKAATPGPLAAGAGRAARRPADHSAVVCCLAALIATFRQGRPVAAQGAQVTLQPANSQHLVVAPSAHVQERLMC